MRSTFHFFSINPVAWHWRHKLCSEFFLQESSILFYEKWSDYLGAISIVWKSSKGYKGCHGEALYCVLGLYKNICYLHLYFGYFWGKRFTEFFCQNVQILGNDKELIKMCSFTCLLANQSNKTAKSNKTAWSLNSYADSGSCPLSWDPVKGWKEGTFH